MSVNLYSYEIDSTKVRTQPEIKPTTEDYVLAVPSFALKLPFKTIEYLTNFTVNKIILSDFGRLILLFRDIDRIWSIYPIIGFSSNHGFKAGFAFTSRNVFTKGERFKLKATYSTHDYQTYRAAYDFPGNLGIFKHAFLQASYKQKPWESFYGLGNNMNSGDEANFNIEQTYFEFGWFHQLNTEFSLSFNQRYSIVNIYDGEDPDLEGDLDQIIESFNLSDNRFDPARLVSSTFGIIHDWRNNPGKPTGGGYELVELSYNKGINRSDDLEYFAARADLRHYLEIFRGRTLAFRLAVEAINNNGDAKKLPFYLLPSLGGEYTLRGYRPNRFLDNSCTLASLEYRFPMLAILDGFVFFEEGRTFSAISEQFTLRNWHYSAGFGLKVWSPYGIVLNAIMAFSKEGHEIHFQLLEEF